MPLLRVVLLVLALLGFVTAYNVVEPADIAVEVNGQQISLTKRQDLDILELLLNHGKTKEIIIIIGIQSDQLKVTLSLTTSPLLLPDTLQVAYFKDGSYDSRASYKYIETANLSCFYGGYDEFEMPTAYFELCNGKFEGEITLPGGDKYLVQMMKDSMGQLSFLLLRKDGVIAPGKCGNQDKIDLNPRETRSVGTIHAPAYHNHSTRYIELYVAIDHKLYLRSGRDLTKTVQRAVRIVNYASSLFRQLNIYLALVGTEVWTERNKFEVTGAAGNVLRSFETYRKNMISPRTPNDNANLFVAERFAEATVGQASASMCVDFGGVAVTSDHYEMHWKTAATTLAHELGHNLGLSHDDSLPNKEECTCPRANQEDDKCIMHTKSDLIQPIAWSKCSIQKVQEEFSMKGIDYCLTNLPKKDNLTPSCGNYFVDPGEECDCGPSRSCDNKCCEPTTCKLTNGSECASGDCCDKDTCQLKPAATKCRQLSDSKCDLVEYCTGSSEWCPEDTYKHDGMQCSDAPAYCFNGRCRSRDTQCQLVWGDDVKSSIDSCYTEWNVHGTYYGHCGYSVTSHWPQETLEYRACLPENSMCGMLQCNTEKNNTALGLPDYLNFKNYVYVNTIKYSCHVVVFNAGKSAADPAVVPDGSSCGEGKWCQRMECVDRPAHLAHCNCSMRGVCDQYNECYCQEGFNPADNCSSPGLGGSRRSGPILALTTTTTAQTPQTTTTAPSNWVAPLVVCLVIGCLVAIAVAAYFNRERIIKFFNKRRATARFRKGKAVESSLRKGETDKLASDPESNGTTSSRRREISNPILESTTNNSMKLFDLPGIPPIASPVSAPISNPIYSTSISRESVPLTLHTDGASGDNCSGKSVTHSDDNEENDDNGNAYEDVPLTGEECTETL